VRLDLHIEEGDSPIRGDPGPNLLENSVRGSMRQNWRRRRSLDLRMGANSPRQQDKEQPRKNLARSEHDDHRKARVDTVNVLGGQETEACA
jgi:hypothetical protein